MNVQLWLGTLKVQGSVPLFRPTAKAITLRLLRHICRIHCKVRCISAFVYQGFIRSPLLHTSHSRARICISQYPCPYREPLDSRPSAAALG
jgi:hypothetical protein